MRKRIYSYKLILIFFIILTCIRSFFSGMNISNGYFYLISFICELLLIISMKFKLQSTSLLSLWFFTLLIIILFSRNFTKTALYFDIAYILMVSALYIVYTKAERLNYRMILRIINTFSVISALFVLLEVLWGTKIIPLISRFLSESTLKSEIARIKRGYGYFGLGANNNVITYSILFILSYIAYFKKNKNKYINFIFYAIVIYLLLLNGERSNLVFIPLAFLTTYFFQGKANKFSKLVIITISILLTISLFFIFEPFLKFVPSFERVFTSLNKIASGEDVSGGRGILYVRAIDLWLKKPILGNGWFYFFNNNISILVKDEYSHVHNLILELLCDCGLIGTIIMLAPIIYTLNSNIKTLKNCTESTSQEESNIYKYCLTFQVFFLLDAMLHVTFYNTYILSMYFLTLMIFHICYGRRKNSRRSLNGKIL